MATKYLYRGKLIFVAPLMGDPHIWGTVWQSDTGGTHRVRVSQLPISATRVTAQKDLDRWAAERKLTVVEK